MDWAELVGGREESGWLTDEVSARPAAQRASALKDRHKFKTEMDAEALAAMFPHMQQKVA